MRRGWGRRAGRQAQTNSARYATTAAARLLFLDDDFLADLSFPSTPSSRDRFLSFFDVLGVRASLSFFLDDPLSFLDDLGTGVAAASSSDSSSDPSSMVSAGGAASATASASAIAAAITSMFLRGAAPVS